jgi:hypothetical protein
MVDAKKAGHAMSVAGFIDFDVHTFAKQVPQPINCYFFPIV